MRRLPWFLLSSTLLGTLASPAAAFEGQWHLGGGLGGAHLSGAEPSLLPLAGVHGAYGLSDMFDLRAETLWTAPKSTAGSRAVNGSALFGVAYKLDVIQWIPWVGGFVGAHYRGAELSPDLARGISPGVSLMFGLDYAFRRDWGFGLAVGLHSLPLDSVSASSAMPYTTGLLRFEKRWGW